MKNYPFPDQISEKSKINEKLEIADKTTEKSVVTVGHLKTTKTSNGKKKKVDSSTPFSYKEHTYTCMYLYLFVCIQMK